MQFSIQASEIASRINQKKEMGCKAFDVVYFEQDGPNDSKVFRALGSQGTAIIKGKDIKQNSTCQKVFLLVLKKRFC